MVKNINMDNRVKEELDRYVSFISKMDGVVRIYLFGSYAYGTPTENSDIDLMVVVNDGVDSFKVMQGVSRGLINRRVPLDVIVDNLSDFTERSKPDRVTLQREIMNNGVMVYGQ
jgi:predicted nucleotidyltransferase